MMKLKYRFYVLIAKNDDNVQGNCRDIHCQCRNYTSDEVSQLALEPNNDDDDDDDDQVLGGTISWLTFDDNDDIDDDDEDEVDDDHHE